MPLSATDIQYKVFGRKGTPFPGHPVCIAYLVMLAYSSLEAALMRKTDHDSPAALSSGSIPGAGGNVYAAFETLKRVKTADIEVAFAFGDEYWAWVTSGEFHTDLLANGQTQADGIKDLFRAKAADWFRA